VHACAPIVAPYGRCAVDLRSVQILRLIQSATFRISDSANVLVVSQFCIRLAVVPTSGRTIEEARRIIGT